MTGRPADEKDEKAGAETPAFSPSADPLARTDPPVLEMLLEPHRSLSRRGFGWVIGATAAGLGLPLVALSGGAVAWGMLPFVLAALVALWLALLASYRRGLAEHLRLWPDLITVDRRDPNGARRSWAANPYWVRVSMDPKAPIENYLTLSGNGRRIELGAFLTSDERVALQARLSAALAELRRNGGSA